MLFPMIFSGLQSSAYRYLIYFALGRGKICSEASHRRGTWIFFNVKNCSAEGQASNRFKTARGVEMRVHNGQSFKTVAVSESAFLLTSTYCTSKTAQIPAKNFD